MAKASSPGRSYLIPAATLGAIAVGLRFAGEELMVVWNVAFFGFFAAAGKAKSLGRGRSAGPLRGRWRGCSLHRFSAPVLPASCWLASGRRLFAERLGFRRRTLRFDLRPHQSFRWFWPVIQRRCRRRIASSRWFSLPVVGSLGGFLYCRFAGVGFAGRSWRRGYFCLCQSRRRDTRALDRRRDLVALAGLDYLFQRWRTDAQLRMSRHEVKEEMREQEGDPQLEGST